MALTTDIYSYLESMQAYIVISKVEAPNSDVGIRVYARACSIRRILLYLRTTMRL